MLARKAGKLRRRIMQLDQNVSYTRSIRAVHLFFEQMQLVVRMIRRQEFLGFDEELV